MFTIHQVKKMEYSGKFVQLLLLSQFLGKQHHLTKGFPHCVVMELNKTVINTQAMGEYMWGANVRGNWSRLKSESKSKNILDSNHVKVTRVSQVRCVSSISDMRQTFMIITGPHFSSGTNIPERAMSANTLWAVNMAVTNDATARDACAMNCTAHGEHHMPITRESSENPYEKRATTDEKTSISLTTSSKRRSAMMTYRCQTSVHVLVVVDPCERKRG